MDIIELRYKPLSLDDEEFYQFCRQNDQLKIERDDKGAIYIISNTGGKTGKLNAILTYWLMNWYLSKGWGHVFDSSTAFRLPNTAVRSPDAAWALARRSTTPGRFRPLSSPSSRVMASLGRAVIR